MIITLSGAPGSGKNQIISSLKEYDYNVVSKSGANGTMEGQQALMECYKSQMEKYLDSEDVYIFESSFIDMIVYTALWIGTYEDNCEEVNYLRSNSIDYQNMFVDVNFNLYADTTSTTYYSENWNAIADLYYGKKVDDPYLLDSCKGVESNIEEIIKRITEYAETQ